jgi:hypothetical protein
MIKTNYRLRLLLSWTLCYILMLGCYIAGQNEDVGKLPRMLELFGAVSAVILPQLTLMFTFYFEKTEQEVEAIMNNKPNSKLAYWFSFSYILIYAFFILIAIPFDNVRPFGWDRGECTYYSVLIMGHIGLFATYATAYLFKIERAISSNEERAQTLAKPGNNT